jgi:hypothetical protein
MGSPRANTARSTPPGNSATGHEKGAGLLRPLIRSQQWIELSYPNPDRR